MTDTLQHNEWSGKTDGQPWMQRSLIAMFRVLPLWLLYGVMALVVPFYMLFSRKGYQAMFRFFRDRMEYGRWKSFWSVYANHYRFGQIILDRFGVYAGKKYDFVTEGQELMDALETHQEGFILLSSHVGNYEIAGYSLVAKDKQFNALVYFGEKASVMQNRTKMFEQTNIRMIPIRQDMSHLFELDNALTNGQIVSIPGDRIWGSSKSVSVTFLGQEARLPMGPFKVITTRGLEVLVVHVVKVASLKYKIYVTPLSYDKTASRNQQVEQLSKQYAEELERIVLRYPTQWYNYFDFWR